MYRFIVIVTNGHSRIVTRYFDNPNCIKPNRYPYIVTRTFKNIIVTNEYRYGSGNE